MHLKKSWAILRSNNFIWQAAQRYHYNADIGSQSTSTFLQMPNTEP